MTKFTENRIKEYSFDIRKHSQIFHSHLQQDRPIYQVC